MPDLRFDSQEHLDAWLADGTYPKIHDWIFDEGLMELPLPAEVGRLADLCCSTGLLGARFREAGYDVAFIEGDSKAIERGRAAGTYGDDPLWEGNINEANIAEVGTWMKDTGIDAVVARRCLCVLSEKVALTVVADVFADAGVRCILLEGQKISTTSVHPFGSGESQAEGMSNRYRITTRCSPNIFFLEAR